MEANIRDYIIDLNEVKTIENKVKTNTKPEVEVVLTNETDLILSKETRVKKYELVLMLGQNLFYKKETTKKDNKETISKIHKSRVRHELLSFFNRTSSTYEEMQGVFPFWLKFTKSQAYSETIESTINLLEKTKVFLQFYNSLVKAAEQDVIYFSGVNTVIGNLDIYKRSIDERDLKFAAECIEFIVENKKDINSPRYGITNIFSDNCKLAFLKYFSCLNANDKKYLFKLILENDSVLEINSSIADSNLEDLSKYKTTSLTGIEYTNINIHTLCEEYNLNARKVIEYFIIGFKYQNLSNTNYYNMTYYRDTLNMQKKMFGKVKDKYPRYLLSEHSIIIREYNLFQDEELKANIEDIMEPHKHLEYSNGEYSIILPKTGEEIMMEGVNLHHCVKSYIQDVIDKKTLILFLRRSTSLDKSLVTIEVKNGVVQQVKACNNNRPDEDIMDFVKKWAEEKSLYI